MLGRVADAEARQIAELHGAEGERVGAGDKRLRGDDRGGGGEQHQRQRGPGGGHLEKRRVGELGLVQEHGALAEVVQRQGREDEREPAASDRAGTKVAHVGIEGLATRHGEEDAAEDDKGGMTAGGEEVPAMPGIECGEDLRAVDKLGDAERAEGDEPQGGDGAEEAPHAGGAEELNGEKHDEDDDGDADDEPLHLMLPS